MKAAKFFAPAKVNLTLHVTGQRAGGYHLLDSLVMFADVGDRVTVRTAEKSTLEIIGPMAAGVPNDGSNLVTRMAELFDIPVAIILSKQLPMAAGIGGGSSDAAATALAICDILETRNLPAGVAELGADIRVCLMRRAARMQGIGDVVTPLDGLPPLWAVLANPGAQVSTPKIFQALESKQGTGMPKRIPSNLNTASFIKWLGAQRNDLQVPACKLEPVILDVLKEMAKLEGAKLTRMSGSGATCFTLFESFSDAQAAATSLQNTHPNWWVHAVSLS